jgi:leucyl-tRNA synthetase
MKIYNALATVPRGPDAAPAAATLLHEGFSILLRVLYPIAPHIAHALWRGLGYAGDPMGASWPEADPAALEADEIELVLQVNGKLRGHLRVAKDADRAAIEKLALGHDAVAKHAEGRPPKKVVVVPGRLVNVVI